MATKNFPPFMALSAVFAQEVVAIRTIKLQRPSFVAVSTVWRLVLSMSTVSLYNVHHLLVKQVGRKAVNFVVRTFGDLTTFRAT